MAQPERLNFNTNVETSPSRDYQPMDVKLSVIMPVFNEVWTLTAIVERVLANPICHELIMVDDGSTDGSRDLLARMDDRRIKCIYHDNNQGKGAAIRTGLKYVSGDVVIIQDADLEYDPSDYQQVVAPIANGDANVVYGSRISGDNPMSSAAFYWGGRVLSFITNCLYGSRITDEPTCYKAFRAEVLKKLDLKCTGFEFCPEVTAKVLKAGIDIVEVPITYAPRSTKQGKKIKLRDGIQAVWTLIRYRFSS